MINYIRKFEVINIMKKHLIALLLLVTFSLAGCGNTTPTGNSGGDNNQSSGDPVNSGKEEDPKPEDPKPEDPENKTTASFTLNFNADYVIRSNSESSEFKDALLSYINHDSEIAESIVIKDYLNIYGKKATDTKKFMVGSANKNGELVINFKTKLVSLDIKAQAQYSAFQRTWADYDDEGKEKPQGYIIANENTANKLTVNGVDWDLNYGHYGETTYQSQQESDANLPPMVDKSFEINSKSLSLKGLAGERVFIYQMTFTYVVE